MIQPLEIKKEDRVLIIAPHPDDECIGAGGILSLYSKQCEVWVLTDGRQGQGDTSSDKEIIIRKTEFENEMQMLKITDYKFFDYQDGTLMQNRDCLKGQSLEKFTKIFVTGTSDNHADHTAAFLAVSEAMAAQDLKETEIYVYEVHTPLQNITHFLDLTEGIEKKLELIRCHKSQLTTLKYDGLARSLAEYRGFQCRQAGHFLETYQKIILTCESNDNSVALQDELQKNKLFYIVLTRWIGLRNGGRSCADILKRRNIHRVIIYGYADIGKLLCEELQGSDVHVDYILDRVVKQSGYDKIPVYRPQAGLPQSDAVIVTAVYSFEAIKRDLKELGFKNIISFREVVGI